MNRATRSRIMVSITAALFPMFLLALVFWPLLSVALESVTDGNGQFTVSRYVEVLTSSRYARTFANTLVLSALSTLIVLIVCLPAGMYIEGERGNDRDLLAILLTIPLSLPGIVIGFFVIIMFGRTGVVPKLFEMATGQRELSFAYTFNGLLLGYIYFLIPRVLLTMRGAIAAISQDALDVAKTLGCSTLQLYLFGIIPSMRRAIVSAASLSLATAFGAYGTAATLSRGFRVVPLEIASSFTESFQPEIAGTMGIILIAFTSIVLFGVGRFNESSVERNGQSEGGRPA